MTHFFDKAAQGDHKLPFTSDRRVWVHDIDGVHWSYGVFGEQKNILRFCGRSKANALRQLFNTRQLHDIPYNNRTLGDLTEDEIVQIGTKSYLETGDGLLGFKALFEDHPEVDELIVETFHLYHKDLHEHLVAEKPHVFYECAQTNALLHAINGQVRHGIASQGCLENWIQPLLAAQKRWDFFEHEAMVDFKRGGFKIKSKSTHMLDMALDLLKANPAEAVFIEDSHANLKTAKAAHPRLFTVLIDEDPIKPCPPDADLKVSSFLDFVKFAAPHFGIQPARQPLPAPACG